ncbi:hypothetical protein QOK74_08480 [Staphylococcus saprophyticus]|uniref:hypothetical protein n=1 Tax=Staphylococcus saprophyticus TaxID=29385 RepID=UPI0024C2B07A|nr:hypothetical protein [Staphylococcus saprophyticus]MDK1672908.1 hypothetical protein [Staphylococcus saprophyticus]
MAIKKVETTEPTTQTKKATTKKTTRKPVRKEIDLQQNVLVMNMTQGSLTYVAKKGTGYLELGEYLDSDYMTVEDLQIMKNAARGMFEKGWLFIDDEEVVEYLGLSKQMEKILLPEELEELFELHPDEVKTALDNLSASVKETVHLAMKKKYEQGELANAHVIRAIEESVNIDPSMSVLSI